MSSKGSRAAKEQEEMPSKQKINRAKVMASLDTICTKCGHPIPPGDLRRIDTFLIECPQCGDAESGSMLRNGNQASKEESPEMSRLSLSRVLSVMAC